MDTERARLTIGLFPYVAQAEHTHLFVRVCVVGKHSELHTLLPFDVKLSHKEHTAQSDVANDGTIMMNYLKSFVKLPITESDTLYERYITAIMGN